MLLHSVVNKIGPEPEPIDPLPASLGRLLATEGIATHFQPIFSARQKSVVGLEALVARHRPRRPSDRALRPLQDGGRGEADRRAVEDLCRESAVATFAALRARPDELLLFLNLDLVGHARARGAAGGSWRRSSARRGPRAAQRRRRVPRGAPRRRGALRRARGGAARARLPGGARRRRRRALEPRSHPAVSPRRHQDRSQPHHRRRRRLLQAGDAQEPGRPLAAASAPWSSPRGSRPRPRRSRRSSWAPISCRATSSAARSAAAAFDDGGFARAAGGVEPLARAFKSHMVGHDQRAQDAQHRRFNVILNRHPLRPRQRHGERVRRHPRAHDRRISQGRVHLRAGRRGRAGDRDDLQRGLARRAGRRHVPPRAARGPTTRSRSTTTCRSTSSCRSTRPIPTSRWPSGKLCRTISTCFRDAAQQPPLRALRRREPVANEAAAFRRGSSARATVCPRPAKAGRG